MGKKHQLKIWQNFYQAIQSGRLTHQLRVNDRDFKEGDTVALYEFDPKTKTYTVNEPLFFEVGTITYITISDIITYASFSLLPIETIEVTAKTETRSPEEIAGMTLFRVLRGTIKSTGFYFSFPSWERCDRKDLFCDAAEKFIKGYEADVIAALDGKGGAA